MDVMNPDYMDAVRETFRRAHFTEEVGVRLVDAGPGWCETELIIDERHQQQNGCVHAGVQATMADHTAGAAGFTVIGADEWLLSSEFKINLLRPAQGERLRCRGQVLKPGRRLVISEAEVYAVRDGMEKLVSKLGVTLAVLKVTGRESAS